ncbi:hypothetical protein NDU88_001810 [Pleurodeles waltl]|uniref:Uncharacterized protein n=1 Tax=Pleurodeles waltl TaxID=8319 RepID=A0AAV7VC22_PLEWA|nr:hypothetical protein NDU88_001810 [Pleurodeles waltl]
MDNISDVRYINYLWGSKLKLLTDLAKDLWLFCLDNRVCVIAEYVPGKANRVSDWYAREVWELDPTIFSALAQMETTHCGRLCIKAGS